MFRWRQSRGSFNWAVTKAFIFGRSSRNGLRRIGDPVAPTQVLRLGAGLGLLQYRNDLLFGEPLCLHRPLLVGRTPILSRTKLGCQVAAACPNGRELAASRKPRRLAVGPHAKSYRLGIPVGFKARRICRHLAARSAAT